MKKYINGKLYNTETAEELAYWSNGLGCMDFGNCSETLYKTKKGNYFIHGQGGPMTRYARSYGNTRTGGEDIIPMSKEQVLQWFEERELIPSDEFEVEEA